MTQHLAQPNVDPSMMERLEHALIAGRINRRGFIRAAAAAGLAGSGLNVLPDELDADLNNQAPTKPSAPRS
jgi:choline dehydrogenase